MRYEPPRWGLSDAQSLTGDWTDDDIAAFLAFAQRLGITDETVPLRVWANESNNHPGAKGGGLASGLFAMTPVAAKEIGYDLASDPDLKRFRSLSVKDQLPWAERYYAKRRGPIDTVARFYVYNYLPSLLSHADDPSFVLAHAGTPAYDDNWWVFDAKRDATGRPIPTSTGASQPDKGYIQVSDLEEAARRATGPRTRELIDRVQALKARGGALSGVMYGGRRTVGFGQEEIAIPAAVAVAGVPSPWMLALATSVVGAATGWVIEEVVGRVRGRRKQ
jgi:hypothetical protein